MSKREEYENLLKCASKGAKGQTISSGFGKSGSNMKLGVVTSVPVKKIGCSVLKSFIEEDKLLIKDIEIINELTTFIAKKQSYEADDGHTDDLVMTLVVFSWLTRQDYFKELIEGDVRTGIYEEELERLNDETTPFGFITTNTEEDGEWDGKDRWFPAL